MPYIGNVLTSFAVETGNINDQAVTAPKLSATGGTDGQVLALDSNLDLEWVSDPAGQWVTSGSNIYYNDGNVGIGTSSPDEFLHVANTGGGASILIETNASSGGNLLFGDNSSNTVGRVQYLHSDNSMRLHANGSERMRIDSSGRVGIGNSTMSSFTGNSSDNLVVGSGSGGEGITVYSATNNQGSITFADGTSGNAAYRGAVEYNHTADRLAFRTAGTGNRMVIDSSGRLLIGTTTGDGQLEVRNSNGIISRAPSTQATDTNKGLRVRNNSDTDTFSVSYKGQGYFAGNVGIGESSPGDKLTVGTTSDSSTAVRIQTTTTGNGEVRFGDSGSATAGYIRYAHNGNHLIFARDNTEAMRISSGGNVGIGTTSPQHLLHLHETGSGTNYLQITNGTTGSTSTDGALFGLNSSEDVIVWQREANNIQFGTNNAERVRIDSSGKVGIGTNSPNYELQVNASDTISVLQLTNTTTGSTNSDGLLVYQNGLNSLVSNQEAGSLRFETSATERMRIDSSGRVLVNTSSARTNYNNTNAYGPILNLEGTSNSNRVLSFIHNDSSGGPFITLGSTGGSSAGSNNLVAAQSTLGFLSFQGADGTDLVEAAQIKAQVDGTPGANDMPGRLVFSTCADGASSPTERVRIDSSGRVGIGTTSPEMQDGNANPVVHLFAASSPVEFRAQRNDGADAFFTARSQELSIGTNTNHRVEFRTNDTERMRIDTSGRLLVGGTASTHSDAQARLQVHSAGATNIVIARTDSSISAGNTIGMLQFYGNDGGTYQQCAEIRCDADLDHANNDKPSRLVFGVTADGASSATERMRIDSSGRVGIGATSFNDSRERLRVEAPNGESGTFLTIKSPDTSGTSALFFGDDDFNEGRIQYDHSNNAMRFFTNDGERLRILSAGGLTFNGDTSAVNALDDYEEGTWTPTINITTTPITGITYTRQAGYYTKIGNVCHVSMWLTWSARTNTSGSTASISLPFTSKNSGNYRGAMHVSTENCTYNGYGFDSGSTRNIGAMAGTHLNTNVAYMEISFTGKNGGGWGSGGISVNGLGSGGGNMQLAGTYLVQ